MRFFWEVIRSGYTLVLLVLMIALMTIGLMKANRWRNADHVLMPRKEMIRKFGVHQSAFQSPQPKFQMEPQVLSLAMTQVSFTTVDAREGGNEICACPICKTVYVHEKDCDGNCPECHKKLMSVIYAGEGYLSGAIGKLGAGGPPAPQTNQPIPQQVNQQVR